MSDPSDHPGKSTSNPLFVAHPPPPPTADSVPPAPTPTEAGPSTSQPPSETVNPLFGATPPLIPTDALAPPTKDTPRDRPSPFPYRDHPYSPPSQNAPFLPPMTSSSPIPQFLRRLTSLLSLILATSALLAAGCSIFFLPLLHATFSARAAVVDQQVDRVKALLSRLRELRGNRLYPPIFNGESQIPSETDPEKKQDKEEHEKEEERPLVLEELHSRPSTPTSSSAHPPTPPPNLTDPTPSLTRLSTSLQSLSSALSSTSTTRTSLLSTLESYTSHLHREIYLRSSSSTAAGNYGMPVNLGTLGHNLNSEIGGAGADRRGEEWDGVRKEVRAIKGMLLGRRSFGVISGAGT